MFGHHSQAHDRILGVSCTQPGVGFNDSDRSIPTQHILWFSEITDTDVARQQVQVLHRLHQNFWSGGYAKMM